MFIILFTVGIFFISMFCFAQDKRLTDPGISVHNYKHPNKARQAKSLGYDKGIVVDLKKIKIKPYKNQNENNWASQSSPYPFIIKKGVSDEGIKEKTLIEIRQKEKEEEVSDL
jgi:hypothetical protein